MHSNQGNPDGADPLALLARTLEADTVQVPAPHSASPMPSGGMAGSLHSVPSGASGSSNPASQPALVGEPSGSYGTLMLSDGGRSKYLGPTAGSEWLKDVCSLALTTLNELNTSSRKRKMYRTLHWLLVLLLQSFPKLQFPLNLVV